MGKIAQACFVLIALAAAGQVLAEERANDQRIVIGTTLLGIHNFARDDDFRRGDGYLEEEIDIAGSSSIYAEWYPWDRFGIGGRMETFSAIDRSEECLGDCFTREIAVSTLFITANWIPWISDNRYSRMVVVAGAGPSVYEIFQAGTASPVGDTATTTAGMAGIYFDWGGEAFGVRAGLERFRADHGSIAGLDLNATGTSLNLDLRWALE